MSLLSIENLNASVSETEILKGINLTINPGETHVIMGPNGSGKSTLSKVLAGYPEYEVTKGQVQYEVNFKQKDLLAMEPEERAQQGVFLAFQYPTEIPGVSNQEFLRAAFNAVTKAQGGEELDPMDFDEILDEKLALLNMDPSFKTRQVNVDFSGGEKKRNEILQMAVLAPRLSILDETDSGLDVDSLRYVANGINKLKRVDGSFLLITHYNRILKYIQPDFVHVMSNGKIIKSGGKALAQKIEDEGFEQVIQKAGGMSE